MIELTPKFVEAVNTVLNVMNRARCVERPFFDYHYELNYCTEPARATLICLTTYSIVALNFYINPVNPTGWGNIESLQHHRPTRNALHCIVSITVSPSILLDSIGSKPTKSLRKQVLKASYDSE